MIDPDSHERNATVRPITPESAEILGHIIPARTFALGQGPAIEAGSVVTKEMGFAFGTSNQGHSGQFYDNLLARKYYWDELLVAFGFLREIKNEK